MAPNHLQLVTPEEADIFISAELRTALYATEFEAWAACKEWPKRYPEFPLSDGCFAHVMNDAITTIARRQLVDLVAAGVVELDDEPGFLLVKVTNPPSVSKQKALGLKFNKVNEDLKPSTNRSYQNASIFKQGFLFCGDIEQIADGVVTTTIATVGWSPDPQMSRDPDFAVACNMSGRLLWSIPLIKPAAGGAIPIPQPTAPQGGPVVRSADKRANKKERRAE